MVVKWIIYYVTLVIGFLLVLYKCEIKMRVEEAFSEYVLFHIANTYLTPNCDSLNFSFERIQLFIISRIFQEGEEGRR